ncbi:Gtr1/RagA G protein Gtr2 [Coprinopsis cinerea okayama7|uniref:GTP-binding protein n=1 Tax=Coprinopsis cinerea (strain Okayama-7 / 130 / ATCC MYA-4618 / FGSC 9003) TaxID=240176 RepID=A8NUB1_COPC7|nr:Gtr1/RagA G protein Gtr2 [Coprinopsis cinerea okayama7\|eukprot:XP_001836416.2 Gtr1/RagA G protein Gtr2 [Coprinopsis cinerea okayama7\
MAALSSTSSATNNQQPTNGHPNPKTNVARTKILLLGLRRAGKTSILEVLFKDLPAKQSFYLETTMRIMTHKVDTVIPLEIWDTPANVTVDTLGAPLSDFATIIFVIDIRDLYNQPISKLVDFIVAANKENPNIHIEVFVHKAEKLQEDDKIENYRQINERVLDRLIDINPDYEHLPINFYLTSVYDHSLHESFSKVLQSLVDSLPYLEDLLNVFCANSQSPKAFLFDVRSRLYVATDASPVDSATHNLCCDYLQMLNSFGPLYRSITSGSVRQRPPPQTPPPTASSSSSLAAGSVSSSPPAATPITPVVHPASRKHPKELFYPSAATTLHPATPGTTLTYHLITRNLALLAVLPTNVYEKRRGLLEYNIVFFREGIQEICDVEEEAREGG